MPRQMIDNDLPHEGPMAGVATARAARIPDPAQGRRLARRTRPHRPGGPCLEPSSARQGPGPPRPARPRNGCWMAPKPVRTILPRPNPRSAATRGRLPSTRTVRVTLDPRATGNNHEVDYFNEMVYLSDDAAPRKFRIDFKSKYLPNRRIAALPRAVHGIGSETRQQRQ